MNSVGPILTKIPNGYSEIVKLYGDPTKPDFTHNLIMVELSYPLLYLGQPVTHACFHRLCAPNFAAAFQLIKDRGLQGQVVHWGGSYVFRPKRGLLKVSVHAFGAACDTDPVEYPLGSLKVYPAEVLECFHKFGLFNGSEFHGRKDPMHTQCATGY